MHLVPDKACFTTKMFERPRNNLLVCGGLLPGRTAVG